MSVVIRLNDYEGPLDLLLHLIRSNEMEIEAVSLLEVIDQYVAYVANMTFDESSDFILTASYLIALKAKYLNKGKMDEIPEDEAHPLEALVEKLKIYRRLKEIGAYLKSRECTDYHFFKEAEIFEENHELVCSVEMLTSALQRVLDRLSRYDDARQEFFRLKRKRYLSVNEKKLLILRLLKTTSRIAFSNLCRTREEVIAVFLALLELLKAEEIKVVQEDNYEEIYIECGGAYECGGADRSRPVRERREHSR